MQFKTIIAAIDLDDDLADGVVEVADSLAKKDGAALQIVSVWPSLSSISPTFSAEVAASSAAMSETIVEQHREGRKTSEKQLADLVARLAPNAKAVILDGDAADAVADHAGEINADLIVTGSHQRNFWSSLFQGSASRDLVQEAPCAVLLVTKSYAAKLKK